MSQLTVQQAMEMAMEHHRAGRFPEAETVYRQVLAAIPDYADALHLLGLMALQLGHASSAAELATRAVAVNPQSAAFHDTLGQALAATGRVDEAIEHHRTALALRPDFAQAYTNLGAALMRQDRYDEATDHLRRAISLAPELAPAHNNLGSCLLELGRADDAIASFRQALSLLNQDPTIHYNLGTSLMLKGELEEGLREYEWRWRVPALRMLPPQFEQPLWDGSDLGGKKILLHAEQGYGDAIQFIRYAPMVAQRGGRVILCVPGPLENLMKNVKGVTQVLPADETPQDFDVHCPLLHLPMVFGTTLDTIPHDVPYLHPDPARISYFKHRLAPDRRRNIGLVWAGRPEHTNDRNRSLRLEQLAPPTGLQNLRFVSLQLGPASEQSKNPPAGMELIDWTDDLHDFADSAALVGALDLVISVDTAAAHLTGAMGKPLFLLLPFLPDWRWMLDRADSPWYPTARLFRQPKRGDWSSPIRALLDALRRWNTPAI